MKNYFILLSMVLFVQCENAASSGAKHTTIATPESVDSAELISKKIIRPQSQANATAQVRVKPKTKVDTILRLSNQMIYVPNVQTCLYIRSSPSISESNIIQCLIPESSAEYISGMSHNLRPTGKTKGDWAEFDYEFNVYTLKPDTEDQVFFRNWMKNRDIAHEAAKKKYRTFRKKGWIKYRNDDATLNIKIPEDGC